jgi:uncharacterized protein
MTEENKFYEELRKEIQPYFEKGGAHDFEHTERVLNLALNIGKKENADLNILTVACLLHDVARKKQDESQGAICHAEEGGKMAEEILDKYNYSFIPQVVHCIQTHRFRNGFIPSTIEAKVLFDSDKLDSIGAVGILRAAYFSGKINARLHNPNVNLNETSIYGFEDTPYREYLDKLSKIKDQLLTDSGKEIAKSRHDYMVSFFDRLNKEVIGKL